jgi:hypothetical protein
MGRETRRDTGRGRAAGILLIGLAAGLVAGATAGPAAALAAEEVNLVTVTGVDLPEDLEVFAEEQPELCGALHREVNWLVRGAGDAPEPDPEILGPEYTLVVHVEGEPKHRFHLYPLAEAGPRVFRPAEQPGDKTVKEAWFYGRLSMPETLAAAGAPLTGEAVAPGGTGGGVPEPEETELPERGALAFIEDWRESMLMTGAVVVAIVLSLGGVAFLIRRKV